MLCGLRDGRQVRQGTGGGHKPTPGMSLVDVLEGQSGSATAAVLREEVLQDEKAREDFVNRHQVQSDSSPAP